MNGPPKVKPTTSKVFDKNKIVTAEEVADIRAELGELLPKLKDGQFTPGKPPNNWLSRIKKKQ